MIHSLPHQRMTRLMLHAIIGVLLISCGSYQQASYYDNDGIYTSGSERVEVNRSSRAYPKKQQEKNSTYSDYFGQKAEEYGQILDSEIFTDIDDYYGGVENDSLQVVSKGNYFDDYNDYNGQTGWGDNPTNVSINIYDGPGYGYGFGYPWLWGGYGGFGFGRFGFGGFGYGGYGYGGYGYSNPWLWGGYGYGFGFGGFGFGGYYSPFRYYSPYNYYGGGYYGHGSYAHTSGRRGYNNGNSITGTSLRDRSGVRSSVRSTSTARYRTNSAISNLNRSSISGRNPNAYRSSGTVSRSIVGVDALDRNRAYRTSKSTRSLPSYNSSSARGYQSYRSNTPGNSTYRSGQTSGTYRSSVPRTSGYSQPSSRNNDTYRSSGSSSSRSSGGTYRSSGNSSNNSAGSYRGSSGGTTRSSSSGSSSSGGGRSNSGGSRSGGRSN